MNKAQKIQILKRAFERQEKPRIEGETDVQYVTRYIQERVQFLRSEYLKMQIEIQLSIENPATQIDVTDL